MESLQLGHEEMKTNIFRLQEKVVDDLAAVSEQKFKGLKRKRNDSATAVPLPEPVESKMKNVMEDDVKTKLEPGMQIVVKEELPPEMQIVVKQEPQHTAPPPAEDDWADVHMGKQQLIRFHSLVEMPKTTENKFPLRCDFCNCTFVGRNRAKVWQHVGSQKHRNNRRLSRASAAGVPLREADDETSGLAATLGGSVAGVCHGLRLNSDFGKKSRVGSESQT